MPQRRPGTTPAHALAQLPGAPPDGVLRPPRKDPEAVWIWKPCNGRCGNRISLVSPSTSSEDAMRVGELCRKRGVVQRYVANPLLIDGYKFDLRVYVVVVSYDPLKATDLAQTWALMLVKIRPNTGTMAIFGRPTANIGQN